MPETALNNGGLKMGHREEAALRLSGWGAPVTCGVAFQQAAGCTLLGLRVKGWGPPGPEKVMSITGGGDSGQRQGGECRKAFILFYFIYMCVCVFN